MNKIQVLNSIVNDDYKKGVGFLLKKCKEKRIYILDVDWVIPYSKFLSKKGACYSFWYNIYKQDRLDRVRQCSTLKDIAYDLKKTLFIWSHTKEGRTYWEQTLCSSNCFNNENPFGPPYPNWYPLGKPLKSFFTHG